MFLNLLILLPLLSFLSSWPIAMVASPLSLPGCKDKCGNVSIPYPFGVEEGCFRDMNYLVRCEAQNDSSPKAYAGTGNLEVLVVSLDGKAKFNIDFYASECFDSTSGVIETAYDYWLDLRASPYWFSATDNKFIAIGCDTLAYISEYTDNDFTTGCVSVCSNSNSVRSDGSCSGIGCCQTPIPWGLKRFNVSLTSFFNHTRSGSFNPCSFAFLAEQDWFTFSLSDISALSLQSSNIPVVMEWAIDNQTCEEAKQDTKSYACGPNSNCSDSTNGPGYRCYCKDGFEGNPYLPHGCQDINECEKGQNNGCYNESAICNNTVGSYSCYCPIGYHGDGWKNGTRCTKDLKGFPLIKVIAGAGISFIFVLVCIYFAYWGIQRRRIVKRREKFFQQNGGLLLRQQISSRRGITDNAGIFTVEELNKATNNFDENQILGQGAYGTVFRGILSSKDVAIKKSNVMDKSQIIQFINEVDILSQINHRNVVKLLGCCLETEVPLLVYEFISNGTLFQHIHNENQVVSISWRNRLRIAAETAGALGYLHFAHSIPILHRDVKSSNILLDDSYMAKVSDFGASRLAPLDQTQAPTLVQGTLGYLDPECFHTGQLTDKSDVYSFGVVLAELLTGQKPIILKGPEERKSLAMNFVSSLKDNNLFQILDYQVLCEGNKEQLVAVAELARRCLKLKGEDRPTMKEVATELDSLRKLYEHPWLQHNHEETQSLLGGPSTSSIIDVTGQESLGDSFMLPLEIAR
ncbi:wall-associated receptor kinase 2-like [Macadamia integrifolia]|uniref:wall-associated receptor kinase 2-like n=1 Tax=Macadamia integrifolia TaxID=60698 RepID=UPI001C4FB1CE|nr:wall-associated receptor kinase 2-like [Macadamia integrifolia]